jgi:DNA-binding transcriptional MerR regulator
MADPLWTLDELIGRVAEALADGYPGAPSARVRDLPDARTVRWYVTRGLVDPPLAMRGRQALYGRRQLLQLVALKRRQAEGTPLAVIQVELAGLPDTALAEIAAVPPTPAGPRSGPRSGPRPGPRSGVGPAGPGDGTTANGVRARFWATAPSDAAVNGVRDADERLERLHGIRLAPGVVLLLDADPAATAQPLDDAALRTAAAPLLALLHRNPTGTEPAHDDDRTHDDRTCDAHRADPTGAVPTPDAHCTPTDEGTRR